METKIDDRYMRLFRDLIYKKSGININETKRELLQSRLVKRMREINIHTYKEYYEYVQSPKNSNEIIEMLAVISTNVTSFFRENHHFEFLKKRGFIEIMNRNESYLNVWSAACSTGEEPYSIAMTIMENIPNYKRYNIKILATDISKNVLETAQRGIYPQEKLKGLTPAYIQKYMTEVANPNSEKKFFKMNDEIKSLIRFRMFNLNSTGWPFSKKFDIIFCRNVMIYFDKPTQEQLIRRFSEYLKLGGYFIVGHSESLVGINHNLKYAEATIYKK